MNGRRMAIPLNSGKYQLLDGWVSGLPGSALPGVAFICSGVKMRCRTINAAGGTIFRGYPEFSAVHGIRSEDQKLKEQSKLSV